MSAGPGPAAPRSIPPRPIPPRGPASSSATPPLEPRPPDGPASLLRALGLGAAYAALVVALLLLARAGAGFIYQGF